MEEIKEELDANARQDFETEETMSDLLRALRRKKGFGLFFVQCNPAQTKKAIEDIHIRFSRKQIEEFELTRQSETLYAEIAERYQNGKFDIACVTGVERALFDYEDTQRLAGWNREEVYSYSWKGVPPLLSHLNRQRESFEMSFSIALVFFVPGFVIDYFVQRAPDFFDWRSGFFKFSENIEDIQKNSQNSINKRSQHHPSLTPQQRTERKLELKDRVRELQTSDPEKASDLLQEQGNLFEVGNEHVEALGCYDRALKLFPRDYIVLYKKGVILRRLGRYEEAVTAYDAVVEVNPVYHLAWYSRGNALSALGMYVAAIESYDRVIAIKPDSSQAWSAKGNALKQLKEFKKAVESYDCALEIKSDLFFIWHRRGDALRQSKQYKKALESCDRAIEIRPDYYPALMTKGAAFYELGKSEDSFKCFSKISKIAPKEKHAWNNQAYLLLVRGSYGTECVYGKPLLIRQSQYWKVNKHTCEVDLNKCSQALTFLSKSIDIDPSSVIAWANKGFPAYYLGQNQDALESCNRALELDPDNKQEMNEVIYTNRGYIFFALEQYNESIESFVSALGIDSKCAEAWIGKGTTLQKLGRYDEALENFNHALHLDHPLAQAKLDELRQNLPQTA